MTQLVLLVVAAVWAAVLLPPMLRSRVDNRPNSSVTDFRRQLSKLQSTATPPRGSMRAMGRPLAQAPAMRSGVALRGQPAVREHGGREHGDRPSSTTTIEPSRERREPGPYGEPRRVRTHGEPTGGQRRPAHDRYDGGSTAVRESRDQTGGRRRATTDSSGPVRRHGDPTGASRRPEVDDARSMAKRRRSNVLFVLVLSTACSLFLAATTGSTVMLYVFALSFLGLCGYVYLLSQSRQRSAMSGYDGWFDTH